MNTQDYITLLNKPYSISERQSIELESILSEFPFLQSARAIHLKALYNQDSFRYNIELKKTAAYTTDRTILFDFITSEQFRSIQKDFFEESEKASGEIFVNDSEIIKPAENTAPENKLEESIRLTIKEAAQSEKEETVLSATPAEKAGEKLGTGKPLEFNMNEKHSFQEWLQLSHLKPISRNIEAKEDNKEPSALAQKLGIIDRFIESNPKIAPVKQNTTPYVSIEESRDNSSLMTETLAKVYLEQKKYSKAIQAYEILILKYPEKSVFFADRISDIKILQQNNN